MPNYRSLIGGPFSSPAEINKVPASVWSNNPGAINGNAHWVQAYPGFVKTVVIGGGNPIAVMETPEQGVALYYQLLVNYRGLGKRTIKDIVNFYGGGQDYSAYVVQVAKWMGVSADTEIVLTDDKQVMALMRAMWRYEAGHTSPLTDAQIAYGMAVARGKAPAKPATTTSEPWYVVLFNILSRFSLPKPAQTDLAGRLISAMKKLKYPVTTKPGELNIIHVRGMDPDGTVNDNEPDKWNDLRAVVAFENGRAVMKYLEAATTEPGIYYDQTHPLNAKGAAFLLPGYYEAWHMGYHRNDPNRPALVQDAGEVTVLRDADQNFEPDGDEEDTGYFGINIHDGQDGSPETIGAHSAGCLVVRERAKHMEFIKLVRTDPRYVANKRHAFGNTLLLGAHI